MQRCVLEMIGKNRCNKPGMVERLSTKGYYSSHGANLNDHPALRSIDFPENPHGFFGKVYRTPKIGLYSFSGGSFGDDFSIAKDTITSIVDKDINVLESGQTSGKSHSDREFGGDIEGECKDTPRLWNVRER